MPCAKSRDISIVAKLNAAAARTEANAKAQAAAPRHVKEQIVTGATARGAANLLALK